MTTEYRIGRLKITDTGANLEIESGYIAGSIHVIEKADRRDFLVALMTAEGIEPAVVDLVRVGNHVLKTRAF